MESGETDEGAGTVWRFLRAAGIQDRSSVPPHVGPQQAVPDTGRVLPQDELRQHQGKQKKKPQRDCDLYNVSLFLCQCSFHFMFNILNPACLLVFLKQKELFHLFVWFFLVCLSYIESCSNNCNLLFS